MSSREDILAQIASSDADCDEDYRRIPRAYHVVGQLSLEERMKLLGDRLVDYGCGVYIRGQGEISKCVDDVLVERGKARLMAGRSVKRDWLPDGFTFLPDENVSYRELDAIDGVITGCELAIAATGTVILRHDDQTARRALSLIPDYHLCILAASAIVETVPEGIRRMKQLIPAPLTTISGPSATSDIEMTRVQGVHGPRTLDVIIFQ